MLWIFVLALIMPINLGDAAAACDCSSGHGNGHDCCAGGEKPVSKNLAEITWAHAVNSQDLLTAILPNEDIQMIEADIVMGKLVKKQESTEKPATDKPSETEKPSSKVTDQAKEVIPIMGHPPATESDLTFVEFVDKIVSSNVQTDKPKGVKLDFKSIEAVQKSLPLLKSKNFKAEVWINADILAGPPTDNSAQIKPVNAKEFFEAIKSVDDLKTATLSIGWTTNVEAQTAGYTDANVDEMIKVIQDNKVSKSHPITFPVRAAIAAHNKDTLIKLVEKLIKDEYKITLTIWSAETDEPDVKKLQELINHFTVEKVYVDVPVKLREKLNLKSQSNGASSLIQYGVLNVATILFALVFRNGFY